MSCAFFRMENLCFCPRPAPLLKSSIRQRASMCVNTTTRISAVSSAHSVSPTAGFAEHRWACARWSHPTPGTAIWRSVARAEDGVLCRSIRRLDRGSTAVQVVTGERDVARQTSPSTRTNVSMSAQRPRPVDERTLRCAQADERLDVATSRGLQTRDLQIGDIVTHQRRAHPHPPVPGAHWSASDPAHGARRCRRRAEHRT